MAVVAHQPGAASTDQSFTAPDPGERVLVTLLVTEDQSPTATPFVVELEGDALRRPHNVAGEGEPPLWVVVAKGEPRLRGDVRFEPRRRPRLPRESPRSVEGAAIDAQDVIVRWRWSEQTAELVGGPTSLISGTITGFGYQETPYLAPDGQAPPPLRTLVLDVDARGWHGEDPTGNPDLNSDGRVDFGDLSILLNAWGGDQPPPSSMLQDLR